jgi:hypothetical protein
MRLQVKFEWRNLEEPEPIQDAAWVIKKALEAAGYTIAGFPEVQGVWDEDWPSAGLTLPAVKNFLNHWDRAKGSGRKLTSVQA